MQPKVAGESFWIKKLTACKFQYGWLIRCPNRFLGLPAVNQMRRIILSMIATNALAAFSVQPGAIGVARPVTPVRAGDGPAGGAPATALPRQPPAPVPGAKVLPRGSLLDLSV